MHAGDKKKKEEEEEEEKNTIYSIRSTYVS